MPLARLTTFSRSTLTPTRPWLVALVLVAAVTAAPVSSQDRPRVVPGDVLITQSELTALGDALGRSVFRAEASQLPPEPYAQVPLVYDGAVVAVDHEGLAFLTTAGWISGAEELVLLDGDTRLPLKMERVDARFGLALLRLVEAAPAGRFAPVDLAAQTPLVNYALLSPGTKYQQLATVSVLTELTADASVFWTTTLGASNGYPVFDARRGLVAMQVRRAEGSSRPEGHAIGWPIIGDFLEPPAGRAEPRAPDSVVQAGPPRANLPTWDRGRP